MILIVDITWSADFIALAHWGSIAGLIDVSTSSPQLIRKFDRLTAWERMEYNFKSLGHGTGAVHKSHPLASLIIWGKFISTLNPETH